MNVSLFMVVFALSQVTGHAEHLPDVDTRLVYGSRQRIRDVFRV